MGRRPPGSPGRLQPREVLGNRWSGLHSRRQACRPRTGTGPPGRPPGPRQPRGLLPQAGSASSQGLSPQLLGARVLHGQAGWAPRPPCSCPWPRPTLGSSLHPSGDGPEPSGCQGAAWRCMPRGQNQLLPGTCEDRGVGRGWKRGHPLSSHGAVSCPIRRPRGWSRHGWAPEARGPEPTCPAQEGA